MEENFAPAFALAACCCTQAAMYMRMRSASSAGAEASIWLKAAWALSYLPSCSMRRAVSYWARAWVRAASAGWVPARVRGFLAAAFFIGVRFLVEGRLGLGIP